MREVLEGLRNLGDTHVGNIGVCQVHTSEVGNDVSVGQVGNGSVSDRTRIEIDFLQSVLI